MPLKKTLTLLLFTSLMFSSCHLVRSLLYLRPDHKDNRKFPKNNMAGASVFFNWEYAKNQIDPKKIKVHYKDGKVAKLDSVLNNTFTNAFMIIKDGKIVLENYFYKYSVNKTHGSFSVSKSMLSTMVGLILEDGLIHSLNEPITKYIPELIQNNPEFGRITIGNIFDMKSGIKIKGKDANPFGDLAKTYYGNNFSRFLKHIEIDTLPGGPFNYNQTDAQLLTLIITRVTGKSLSEYFNEKIWSKIGAQPAYWNTYRKDKLEKGFCCYNARVQDYAKFAQLYLQNGNWNGEQLIPKKWIEYTTNKTIDTSSKWEFSFHKYWFPANDGGSDYTAQGYNRQIIYINPENNIAILRFGQKDDKSINWEKMMREIVEQIN